MGRTLHFEVLNSKGITDEEKGIMLGISNKYNEGQFEGVWTCESFYLNPWDYYPNWKTFEVIKTVMDVEPWEMIDQTYHKYRESGMTIRESYERLEKKDKLILFHSAPDDNICGFCKTGSNEYNSLLVYLALLEISVETSAEISLSDEGEFLLGDVIIKNGKVKFDVKSIKRDWEYWEEQNFIEEDLHGCGTKMRNQKAMLKLYPGWIEPHLAVRPVDPEDFKEHPEYGAAQIMGGFEGEYWGLNQNDPEKESYNMVALIAGALVGTDLKLQVGAKIGPGAEKEKKEKAAKKKEIDKGINNLLTEAKKAAQS